MKNNFLSRRYQEIIGGLIIINLIIFWLLLLITKSLSVISYPILGLFLIAIFNDLLGLSLEKNTDFATILIVIAGFFLIIVCNFMGISPSLDLCL